MKNFNENGIIVLSQDNLPVLANQIAEIVVNEMSRAVDLPVAKWNVTPDTLISKAKACEILERCDSTLSKWAQKGIITPIRRGSQLYYRYGDVMKIYRDGL